MSLLPQEPQAIGKVLDAGITLYRRGLSEVLGLSVLSAAIIALIDPNLWSWAGFAAWQGALLYIAGLVLYVACYLGLTRKLADVAEGASLGSGADYVRFGLRRLGPALFAFLLYILAMLVGLVLLIIPGLILMISLMLSFYIVTLENAGGLAAIKRSHRLVWGNWWRTATVITVASLIYMAAYAAVIGLGMALAWGLGVTVADADGLKGVALIVFILLNAVMSALLGPLMLAITLALYQDLKLRKEGGDLASRIGALSPA